MTKDKIRIAAFVSGGGTNLQAIIDAQKEGKIPDGEIVLVLSNSSKAYALERAKNAGIKAECVLKKQLGSQEAFEEKIHEILAENGIELIVLAGFMTILSEQFTARYPGRILNIHPALLPSFGGKGFYGLHVHEAALKRGVKITGATVHYVNEIPDGGEIISQKAVEVKDGDTPEELQQRVMKEAEWVIYPAAVQIVCAKLRAEK